MAIKASPDAGLAGCWAVLFFVRAVLAMAGGAATGINPDYSSCLSGRWHARRFSVWHHLDANGIRFKSITPQKTAC